MFSCRKYPWLPQHQALPGGGAAFMKPPQWLHDSDVVGVDIESIVKIRNPMVFES